MKKTLVILGSPRKNGNSAILANKVVEGVIAAGGECETIYLNDMNIHPCQACNACRKKGDNKCVMEDDMQFIYAQLSETKRLILATPIYMFSLSAQLKLFLDRCYAVYPLFEGKRIGIILSYGGTDEFDSGAVNAINALMDLYAYYRAEIVGIVQVSALDPGDVCANRKVLEEAVELGKSITGFQ